MKSALAITKNNKGMTMTEVIIGFVVLMLFLGGLSGIIAFSANMLMESIDIGKAERLVESEIYKTNPTTGRTDIGEVKLQRDGETISLSHMDAIKIDSQAIDETGTIKVVLYGFLPKDGDGSPSGGGGGTP